MLSGVSKLFDPVKNLLCIDTEVSGRKVKQTIKGGTPVISGERIYVPSDRLKFADDDEDFFLEDLAEEPYEDEN